MDFHEEDDDIIRSSHSQMFLKISVLKNFAIFQRKHLCRSLFLRTPFLQNISGGCFFIILLLLLHLSYYLIWLDFFSWKKYYFDFFTDLFF